MTKSLHKLLALCILWLLLFTACAPQPAPTAPAVPELAVPAPSAVATPTPRPERVEAWVQEWEKVMEGAKREGRVVVYSTAGAYVRTAISRAFKEKYGIGVESIGAMGPEVSQRVLSEQRAGIYSVDIIIGATTDTTVVLKPGGHLAPLKPELILPEVTNPKLWWRPEDWSPDELLWLDKDKRFILTFPAYPQTILAINTKLVSADEVKSYRDLLNPKWKGKIVMSDPTLPGPGIVTFRTMDAVMGQDYLSQLAKQEPVINRDFRLGAEWLAHGKYSLVIGPLSDPITELKDAGAPLAFVEPVEGVAMTGGHGTIALVKSAPHPNVARLFINWLLTKEGQLAFCKPASYQSARLDVPSDYLPSSKVRRTGVKYWFHYTEDFMLGQAAAGKRAREVFGHLMK